MSPEYQSWVPAPIRQACENVCRPDSPWPESSRHAARQLVTDTRMESFYRSGALKWSSGHNRITAWKLWFDAAHSATGIDEKGRREAVKRQQENVTEFADALRRAAELLNHIEEDQESAPVHIPLHFSDVLHLIEQTAANHEVVTSRERARYELNTRPRLEEIFSFNSSAACFVPSVSQILSALAHEAERLAFTLESRKTIPWSSHSSDWLASQKESGIVGVYIRTFDRAMWNARWQFESLSGEPRWRIPDSLLALQTKVALGVSEKEVPDGFADRIRKWRIKPEDFERELG